MDVKFEDLVTSDMKKRERDVLFVIYSILEDHEACFVRLSYIAKQIGCSKRTVQRQLDKLLMRGIISKKHRFSSRGRQRSNVYYINIDRSKYADNIKANIKQKRDDRKTKSKQLKDKIARKKAEIRAAVTPSEFSDMVIAANLKSASRWFPDPRKYDKESEQLKRMFAAAHARIKRLRAAVAVT